MKFNRTSLARESRKSNDYSLSGICTDNTSVYVSSNSRMELIVLTHELIEERCIPLITQYKQGGTRIRDISLAREEFYVLLSLYQNIQFNPSPNKALQTDAFIVTIKYSTIYE